MHGAYVHLHVMDVTRGQEIAAASKSDNANVAARLTRRPTAVAVLFHCARACIRRTHAGKR
jgi:hypothetical protein